MDCLVAGKILGGNKDSQSVKKPETKEDRHGCGKKTQGGGGGVGADSYRKNQLKK